MCGFALAFAYSFMLGQRDTIKLILCIYISILAADGLTGALNTYVFEPSPGIVEMMAGQELQVLAWMRVILFLAGITLFVVRSGFHVHIVPHDHWVMRFGIHMVFSALSALLLLCAITVYLTGLSFIEGLTLGDRITVFDSSWLAQMMLQHLQVWFALPAVTFLVVSLMHDGREMEI